MTAQERAKSPLLGPLLFLAVVAGCGLYYYTKERGPDAALHNAGNAPVLAPSGPAPSAPIQPPTAPPAAPDLAPAPGAGDSPTDENGLKAMQQTPEPPRPQEAAAQNQGLASSFEAAVDSPSAAEAKASLVEEGLPAPQSAADNAQLPPPSAAPEGPRAAEPAPESAQDKGKAKASGVVVYGKGKALKPGGSVALGDIPPDQEKNAARVAPSGQDSVVRLALVQDLAAFLAENYWPAGTHPLAEGRGISTAGVKWANSRYGGHLRGFALMPAEPSLMREQALRYVLVPSMLQALYGLYGDRFYEALRAEASSQRRGPAKSALAPAQMAELFDIYSGMAGNLAGALRAYVHAPHIRPLAAAYAQALQEAASAQSEYAESREQPDTLLQRKKSQAWQSALKRREQAALALATALRQGGAGQGMDADSLLYTAQWLYRRSEQSLPALSVLAAILDDCSLRLSALAQEYRLSPSGALRR